MIPFYTLFLSVGLFLLLLIIVGGGILLAIGMFARLFRHSPSVVSPVSNLASIAPISRSAPMQSPVRPPARQQRGQAALVRTNQSGERAEIARSLEGSYTRADNLLAEVRARHGIS